MKPIINKITDEWIAEKKPCMDAIDWWNKKERNPIKIIKLLIKEKKYDWANWFIVGVIIQQQFTQPRHRNFELLVTTLPNNLPPGWKYADNIETVIPFNFDLEELCDAPTQVYEDGRIRVKIRGH